MTGQVEEGKRVRGKWGIEPERDIDFRLAESGLTFTGEYGPPTAWVRVDVFIGTVRKLVIATVPIPFILSPSPNCIVLVAAETKFLVARNL
ncbi:hypothetical protein GCM10028808_31200 [Spirosoma migulaei]